MEVSGQPDIVFPYYFFNSPPPAPERVPGLQACCKHRCPFWLVCSKNRGPWFTWWFNHLPGPSICPKRTPMVSTCFKLKSDCPPEKNANPRHANGTLVAETSQYRLPETEALLWFRLDASRPTREAEGWEAKGRTGPSNGGFAFWFPFETTKQVETTKKEVPSKGHPT